MVREPDATMQPTLQDNQLMSKHHVPGFKPQLRLEWRGQDGQNETKPTRSFRQLRRFHHVINSDKVFGTHNCAFLTERAEDGEVKRALKRTEEAWRTLTREQDQLDNKRWSTKKPLPWRLLSPYPTAHGGLSRGTSH